MIPFTGNPPQPITAHHDVISGFWEDYICPTHFTTARRAFWVSQEGADLETAYHSYLNGIGTTTPVPHCPQCHQTMLGGQSLDHLPFYLNHQIEVQTWIIQKLEQFHRMVAAEENSPDAEALLAAEAQALTLFHQTLCRQLNISQTSPPFFDDIPRNVTQWYHTLQRAKHSAENRLSQLRRRQQIEAQKKPGLCPNCQQHSVYLRRKATF